MTTLPTHYSASSIAHMSEHQKENRIWSEHANRIMIQPPSNIAPFTNSPAFIRGHFTLTETGDTFLDIHTLGKGELWINGHALGRFWNVGPQQTLYVPGPWLRKGTNEIVIFDLKPTPGEYVTGLDHPILDGPVPDQTRSSQQ